MKVSKRVKTCFVKGCLSNSEGFADKVFITVPQNEYRRRAWFEAARQPYHYVDSKSLKFCCEDHFNLKEDMENYMRFKLMGGHKKIKPDVVPHIFNFQPDRKRASAQPARVSVTKGVKKQLVQEAVVSTSASTQPLTVQNILSVESDRITEHPDYEDGIQENKVSTKTSKPSFSKLRSVSMHCKLHDGVSIGLSPPQILHKHVGTSPGLKEVPTLKDLYTECSSNSSTNIKTEKYSGYYEEYFNKNDSLSDSEKLLGEIDNEFKINEGLLNIDYTDEVKIEEEDLLEYKYTPEDTITDSKKDIFDGDNFDGSQNIKKEYNE